MVAPDIGRALAVTDCTDPEFKILWAIVVPHAVDVVDGLTANKWATKDALHDNGVLLAHPAPVANLDVSRVKQPPVAITVAPLEFVVRET